MDTLLLRLAAPMQSWGSNAKFDKRGTEREPTKSGVIGMLAAALGWTRDHDLSTLSECLRFGVRVDREGKLLTDLQIAKSAKNKFPTYREYLGDESKVDATYLTYRDYLCDAIFLVGLEGSYELLEKLKMALENPVFPLYLGRRSCPPEGRLVLEIARNKDLETALEDKPCLDLTEHRQGLGSYRILVEQHSLTPEAYIQRDQPISFHPERRVYGARLVVESILDNANMVSLEDFKTENDFYDVVETYDERR
ncbi:MAG: type I-E CRISPR-associated protein Cas5/CasD [Eubacteriales bacterium]|nr:type I-E CRISPR-associated protein Cas5/CasD [Eubacteriales bacterium]